MRSTIDSAGRLVIPKPLRDAAGIGPGTPLEVRIKDGIIEIEPATMVVDFLEVGGISVAKPLQDGPSLTSELVEATIERARSERGR